MALRFLKLLLFRGCLGLMQTVDFIFGSEEDSEGVGLDAASVVGGCCNSSGFVEESGMAPGSSSPFSASAGVGSSTVSPSLRRTSCSKNLVSFLFLLVAFFMAASLRRNLSAGVSFFILKP